VTLELEDKLMLKEKKVKAVKEEAPVEAEVTEEVAEEGAEDVKEEVKEAAE